MTAASVGPRASDEDLFLAFVSHRDTLALGELFRRRAAELLQLATTLGPTRSDAEDLLQATFVTAMRDAGRFDVRRRVVPWLCGILANHARALRRERRRGLPVARPSDAEDAVEPLLRAEVRAAVDRAITAMAAPYRSVLLLQLRQGLDGPAIAQQLGSNPAAVRKQLSRAYALLRQAMPVGLAMGVTIAALPAQVPPPVPFRLLRRQLPALVATAAAALVIIAIGWAVSSSPPVPSSAAIAAAEPLQNGDDAAAFELLTRGTADAAVALAAPEPSDARLRVVARYRDGTPAAGVPIQVLSLGSEPPAVRSSRAPVGVSNADGVATFADLVGAAVLVGSVDQLPIQRVELRRGSERQFELVLDGPFPIHGAVVDALGSPVADAVVAIADSGGRHEQPVSIASTDALGQFQFAATRRNPKLFARAAGHGDSLCRRADEGELVLQLCAAAPPLVVEVLGPDGSPLPDAHVTALPQQPGLQQFPLQHALADAFGRARFTTLPDGAAAVVARRPGLAPARGQRADADARGTVRLRLSAPARIDGSMRVTDGMPRPLRVFATPLGSSTAEPMSMLLQSMAEVGDDGAFVLHDVAPGAVVVRVMHERRTAAMHRPDLPLQVAVAQVDLVAGEQRRLALEPLDLARLHGVVSLSDGTPAAGWTVTAAARDLRGLGRRLTLLSGTTNASGHFLLPGADPRIEYDLFAHAPDRRASDPNWFPSAIGIASADGARLHASALPTTTLRVAPSGPELEVTLAHASSPHRVRLVAEASGWRTVEDLPAGDYRLEASAPGRGRRSLALSLRGGEQVVAAPVLGWPASLVVQTEPDGLELTAALVDEHGDEHARASGPAPLHLPPVQPGRYRLRTFGSNLTAGECDVEIEGRQQRLRLPSMVGAPCAIRIVLANHDNPLLLRPTAMFRLERLDGGLRLQESLRATDAGEFSFTASLAPGEYRLEAATLWGRRGSWLLTVPSEGLATTLSFLDARR